MKTGRLDPRTKLILLLLAAVIVLGGAGGKSLAILAIGLSVLPFVLLILAKKLRAANIGGILFALGLVTQYELVPLAHGTAGFLVVMTGGILTRLVPSIMMGKYTVDTTTASEFLAAMERMHVPKQLTIPISVMFRFFPTIGEERRAIRDAMKMRGIHFSVEYRMIPMIMSVLQIGEELSAAALIRGLAGPYKRTNICKIGFRWTDAVLLLAITALTVFSVIFRGAL